MRCAMRRVAFVGDLPLSVVEALRAQGCRVESIDGSSVVAVARDLMRLRPAVVHARASHLKLGLVARLLNVPLVVQAGRGDVNATTARAARAAERTLCPTVSLREALIEQGAPASTTTVMRGLLDPEADLTGGGVFPPILDQRLRWVVSAAPCDGPHRGHADLLLAFLSLARTRPRLHLLIAGAGAEGRALLEQADRAGMRGRVVVHPLALDQLPGVLTQAAAVVAPSRTANLPDAVPEALALGAPVVATAVGQHPVWIREGRTGFLVPPRAPAALATRLGHVVDDPALAARVGAAARQAALELTQPHLLGFELARCWATVSRAGAPSFTGLYLPEPPRARI
ncbi:MAG TPA: glycosyltransferase [Myxococcales bacterium]|nr:glycosyltransferase [Myxococcales bacterium]